MTNKIFTVMYGPATAGKSLIAKSLKEHCGLDFYEPPVLKSKSCRPNRQLRPDDNPADFLENDEEIKKLGSDPRYIITQCRENWQAFDLENVVKSENPIIFRDLYYTFIPPLYKSDYLKGKAEIKTLFISPMSQNRHYNKITLTSLMSQRLALRSFKQKGDKAYSQAAIEDNELRARTAYAELLASDKADKFIYNQFPEGHPDWNYDDKNGSFLKRSEEEVMKIVKEVENFLIYSAHSTK
jgi:hypothetical protein